MTGKCDYYYLRPGPRHSDNIGGTEKSQFYHPTLTLPRMDQPLPDWLSNDFLAQSLRKEKGNENIVVTNFMVSAAAPPGNNYGSFIIRTVVDYKNEAAEAETHSVSLIIKAELTQGPFSELGLSKELQMNEPSFYYKFIPAAKQFANVSFAAKCFFSPKPNVTILEDLKEQGFVMCDRVKQLDFDHCRLYMKAAASFHAVSVAVYKNHPELLEPIKDLNFYSNDSVMRPSHEVMIKHGFKFLADATETIPRFNKYGELLRDSIPEMWNLLVEANKESKFFKTIRQGDPWITNMMFKYDKERSVEDVKIIDFQATTYGSPINDVVFFIWTSANNDVKKNRIKELYRIYIETLNENLKNLNCTERLTYKQLEEEVERLIPNVLLTVIMIPNLFDPEPMDIGAIFSKEGDESKAEHFFKKNYTDSFCNNYLPGLLESLELNGVFDFLESRRK